MDHRHSVAALSYLGARIENWRRLKEQRVEAEKAVTAAAKSLPVYQWAEDVTGLSALGVGLIVGAAGDLSGFATVSKLWKWMSLAVDGQGRAQRRRSGETSGANPDHRKLMFMLASAQVMHHGPFEAVYRHERERFEHRYVCMARGCDWRSRTDEKVAKCPECDTRPANVAHKHANRVTAKALLREMWIIWTGANPDRELLTERPRC